jgi:hypothetical protein
MEKVFKSDQDLFSRLSSSSSSSSDASVELSSCLLRQLTLDYTCQLSVLYGIQQSGVVGMKKVKPGDLK